MENGRIFKSFPKNIETLINKSAIFLFLLNKKNEFIKIITDGISPIIYKDPCHHGIKTIESVLKTRRNLKLPP